MQRAALEQGLTLARAGAAYGAGRATDYLVDRAMSFLGTPRRPAAARRLTSALLKRPRLARSTSLRKAVMKISHEMKNTDTVLSEPVSSLFYSDVLNAMQQGSNANERTGRDAVIEYVQLQATVYLTSVAVSAQDLLRVMLVWDREARGAAFADTDLFSAPGAGTTMYSQLNFDNAHRFKILMDRTYNVESTAIGLTGATSYVQNNGLRSVNSRKVKIGLKAHYFNTNNGTIADIDSGALFLVLVSAQGNITWDGGIRVYFRDV